MKRFSRSLVFLLLLLLLCLPGTGALADEAEELENEAENVEQTIENLERLRKEEEERAAYYTGLYEALQTELDGVNADMDLILEQLMEIDSQIGELDEEILRLTREEKEAAAVVGEQKAAMAKRIQYMYEQQTSSFWDVLAGAVSLGAVMNSADYMASVSAYDQQMLEEYKENLQTLGSCREESSRKQREILALQDQTADRKKTVAEKAGELLSRMSAYENEIEAAGERAAGYAVDISDMREQAEALREAARIAAEEAARQAAREEAERLAAEEARRIAQEEAERLAREAASMQASDARGVGSVDISGDWMNPSGYTNLELLAAILECECGSQTWEGQVAVGNVIFNRILDPHFQMTLYDVIYGPGQFTPTWTGTLDIVLARGAKPLCMDIARDILNGARVLDYRYLYFCSPNSWVNNPKRYTDYTFICYHYFYY